jgi:hypothetical protein
MSSVLKNECSTKMDGPVKRFRFFNPDKTPSWKRYGDGTASLTLDVHNVAGWMSVTASEFSHVSASKQVVKRTAMMTLDKEQAVQLRDFLIQSLEGVA